MYWQFWIGTTSRKYLPFSSSVSPPLHVPCNHSGCIQTTLKMRLYLHNVIIPAHRTALTRLLCSDHILAVEMYRRVKCPKCYEIAQNNRPCRYCYAPTESEIHALFLCAGSDGRGSTRHVLYPCIDNISFPFTNSYPAKFHTFDSPLP
ncbi:hypothetical protein DFP72DRAFT_929300 [Ephemerocybe angulata]|uniref:Uncharacterized protein n=1 Tax=Ephemerocybe angulata TaxID=980116 RepID=A0A8H6LX53_9AGAR|nr:hypothetical protein DFP72DRAFT_929300 [Tulosesus angulatus]